MLTSHWKNEKLGMICALVQIWCVLVAKRARVGCVQINRRDTRVSTQVLIVSAWLKWRGKS